MPEVLEVESYRVLADSVVGSRVRRGFADGYAAKGLHSAQAWSDAVRGRQITGTGRQGKLLWLETDGPRLGWRFGMTGVLLVDSTAGIEGLFYGPHTFREDWIRAGLELEDGRRLVLHDPRRLARVVLDPDLDDLGPDVLTVTRAQFSRALRVERGEGPAVKARLLDQSHLAGVGNLLGDEALFRACLDPRTPVGRLDEEAQNRLWRSLRATVRTLGRRGGSHTGDHMPGRIPGGVCPRDGAPMRVETIGGRTTYWCSRHQT